MGSGAAPGRSRGRFDNPRRLSGVDRLLLDTTALIDLSKNSGDTNVQRVRVVAAGIPSRAVEQPSAGRQRTVLGLAFRGDQLRHVADPPARGHRLVQRVVAGDAAVTLYAASSALEPRPVHPEGPPIWIGSWGAPAALRKATQCPLDRLSCKAACGSTRPTKAATSSCPD